MKLTKLMRLAIVLSMLEIPAVTLYELANNTATAEPVVICDQPDPAVAKITPAYETDYEACLGRQKQADRQTIIDRIEGSVSLALIWLVVGWLLFGFVYLANRWVMKGEG